MRLIIISFAILFYLLNISHISYGAKVNKNKKPAQVKLNSDNKTQKHKTAKHPKILGKPVDNNVIPGC